VDALQRRVVARIRELAKDRGIAVTHLPDRAGVARSHFWNVLRGTTSPTLRWIGQIAKALGVDASELFRPSDGARRKRRDLPPHAGQR
jgi:transcriptional regulator with XRE-family HTH domain